MNTKPILAFDCSGSGARVSLAFGAQLLSRSLPQGAQATELVPTIHGLLQELGIHYAALGAIVTTTGPGSFTGLRIGLAALHGLVLVHPVAVKLLSSLEALAWQAARAVNAPPAFSVAMPVGKGELAAQDFLLDAGRPVADGEVYRVAENFLDWRLPCFGNHLPADDARFIDGVDTGLLCQISELLPARALAEAVPFYIRPPDAAIPKPHAWLAT